MDYAMTAAELLALAQREALQTTITPSEFLLRVRASPAYDFRQAHWFKVMQALEQLKHAAPAPVPPPPPPGVNLEPVRNLIVWATVTDDAITQALTLPQKWKHLFSADPAYKPSVPQVRRVQVAGRYVAAWCDCRTTLPDAAKRMVADYGLGGWYGQGENAAEFDVFLQANGLWAIVNLSALRPEQLGTIAVGAKLVTNENYRNVNPNVSPDWRNANKGIGGNTGAVYGSVSEGAVYTSARSQYMNGWFGPNDSWYVEGFTAADWQAVRELG